VSQEIDFTVPGATDPGSDCLVHVDPPFAVPSRVYRASVKTATASHCVAVGHEIATTSATFAGSACIDHEAPPSVVPSTIPDPESEPIA
jgi:hypothetical protein